MKLFAMLLSSLVLALGGAGAASAVNNYIRAHVETTTLPNLDDVTATPTPTVTVEHSSVGISAGAETEIGE